MRDDFSMNQVSGLECVYLSKTEHYQLDCFIRQYVKTRNLRSIPDISDVLRSALEGYPGKPPIMVNELNAWIDKTLGYRASHPDFPQMEDV
ncbi:hypothetical protein NYP20_11940 [Pseudomonas sp. N3-W]|uniref:hypothetical protein n=1 Tax=Pseudomonas sp. N3-W TaxID=2975049 RepID=UPI00217DC4B4|nr:hypothetical protein [Pseudomonas sp. N3-W]UWF51628.1 hypothetical protein NYP20_11940 [Pseudomonas sp. N3-W]